VLHGLRPGGNYLEFGVFMGTRTIIEDAKRFAAEHFIREGVGSIKTLRHTCVSDRAGDQPCRVTLLQQHQAGGQQCAMAVMNFSEAFQVYDHRNSVHADAIQHDPCPLEGAGEGLFVAQLDIETVQHNPSTQMAAKAPTRPVPVAPYAVAAIYTP